MLSKFKTFIETLRLSKKEPEKLSLINDIEQAALVLMVEVISSDQNLALEEEQLLRQLLKHHTAANDLELDELIDQAKQDSNDSLDLYHYAKKIREHFDIEQKTQLMEQLWRLAYADGQLDKYETYTIRKIADLIYIPHSDYIKAKQRVKTQQ